MVFLYCSNCGTQMSERGKYCTNCGRRTKRLSG
ncbi:zinc-ribbon domain-containing protein [uncultured Metabacillus sp.]